MFFCFSGILFASVFGIIALDNYYPINTLVNDIMWGYIVMETHCMHYINKIREYTEKLTHITDLVVFYKNGKIIRKTQLKDIFLNKKKYTNLDFDLITLEIPENGKMYTKLFYDLNDIYHNMNDKIVDIDLVNVSIEIGKELLEIDTVKSLGVVGNKLYTRPCLKWLGLPITDDTKYKLNILKSDFTIETIDESKHILITEEGYCIA